MTEVLIALGGNLGHVAQTLVAARQALQALPETTLVASSSLYQSIAIGPGEQPDYLNAVLLMQTKLGASELLQAMHTIEDQCGRERIERWGARTLDLDLLAYGDCCCDDAHLQLPHPRIAERMFVLAPMMDVAADWCHPQSGQCVEQMVAALQCSDPTQCASRVCDECAWDAY